MAVFIIVYLKVININEQDSKLALANIDEIDLVVNGTLNRLTVIKTGKAVIACSFGQKLFTLLCTVDINNNTDYLSYVAVSVTDSSSTEQYPYIVAVNILPAIFVSGKLLAL